MGELLERHPLRELLFGKRQTGGYGVDGVRVIGKGQAVTKAEKDGVYVLDGGHFLIKKGDTLPPGAVMRDELKKPDAKKAPAPSENTASSGPKEKS